jgi:hypothetical protein
MSRHISGCFIPVGPFLQQWFRAAFSPIKDRNLVTRFLKMARHGQTHDACTDPSYFHGFLLFSFQLTTTSKRVFLSLTELTGVTESI